MCNWSEAIIERIRRDVVNEFTDEVKNNIIDKVTKEIRNEVTNEIRNEVTNEIRNEITNEATQKSNERAIINIMSSLECSFEKACEILKLNPTDYASLKERLIETAI